MFFLCLSSVLLHSSLSEINADTTTAVVSNKYQQQYQYVQIIIFVCVIHGNFLQLESPSQICSCVRDLVKRLLCKTFSYNVHSTMWLNELTPAQTLSTIVYARRPASMSPSDRSILVFTDSFKLTYRLGQFCLYCIIKVGMLNKKKAVMCD